MKIKIILPILYLTPAPYLPKNGTRNRGPLLCEVKMDLLHLSKFQTLEKTLFSNFGRTILNYTNGEGHGYRKRFFTER